MQNSTSRSHGLQRPFHNQQMISWCVFGFEVIITYLVFIPPLKTSMKIGFGATLAVLQLSLIFFAYMATVNDPTDLAVIRQKESLKHFCTLCNTRVGSRTKHCGQCNRCVELFDHHCFWLNNCIGKTNYKHFIGSISSLFLLSVFKIALAIYIIRTYFEKTHLFDEAVGDIGIGTKRAIVAGVLISLILNVIIFVLFLELLLLHAWLKRRRMTTYEFIIFRREQKTQKQSNPEVNMSPREQERRAGASPKHQRYKSKVIMKLEDQSTSTYDHSFMPFNRGSSDAQNKTFLSRGASKLTIDDPSMNNISINQRTQISSKKEAGPAQLGLGEKSFEVSDIGVSEEDRGYQNIDWTTPRKEDSKHHSPTTTPIVDNNDDSEPEDYDKENLSQEGASSVKHTKNDTEKALSVINSSNCNIEDDESNAHSFRMNDLMDGMKDGIFLKNPMERMLKLGCSFDDEMANYVMTPSARPNNRPLHFEFDFNNRVATEPDQIELDILREPNDDRGSHKGSIYGSKARHGSCNHLGKRIINVKGGSENNPRKYVSQSNSLRSIHNNPNQTSKPSNLFTPSDSLKKGMHMDSHNENSSVISQVVDGQAITAYEMNNEE